MELVLLALAAFCGGVMNAIAGGGSFLTFPALVFSGVPPVIANATSTVALFPGAFASAWSYRKRFAGLQGLSIRACVLVSLAGGAAGSILLLKTPESTFVALIPWLLLFATVLFAFGKPLGLALRKRIHFGIAAVLFWQLGIAIYGGYFGGGIGILMLALFSLFGIEDLNAANGMKALLAGCMNGMAVLIFVAAGQVYWKQALVMAAGGITGGYTGAAIAQRVPQPIMRAVILAIAVSMTAYFFFWKK